MVKISPSLLSADFGNLKADLDKINRSAADWLHIDIMDGVFTDKATNNCNDLLAVTKNVNKPKDVHLMVIDIKKYTDIFSKINPNYLTFHLEATDNPREIIDYIKSKNIKVGIAINPQTAAENLVPYLADLDLVLVMSVEAGAGGQTFIDISDKIKFLANYRQQNNLNYIIEVDGGINPEVIDKVKNADMVVVGSFITNGNIKKQIEKIRRFI